MSDKSFDAAKAKLTPAAKDYIKACFDEAHALTDDLGVGAVAVPVVALMLFTIGRDG